jgi:hypothetical protein
VRISAPTIVNTRLNTTKVNLWVETLITSDSEYVVASSIELQALDPTSKLIEGVTQSQR